MKKTLLLFAHPSFEKSRANAALLAGIRDLDHVTIHDLYEAYPDFMIRVNREQDLLLENERIVLQHPFFWYSTPAIVKEWFDIVLEYGWAYGRGGNALHGKSLLSVVTAGGSEDDYEPDGQNRYRVSEFLRPIEQTAVLCGMTYEEPMVVYSALSHDKDSLEREVERYRELLAN